MSELSFMRQSDDNLMDRRGCYEQLLLFYTAPELVTKLLSAEPWPRESQAVNEFRRRLTISTAAIIEPGNSQCSIHDDPWIRLQQNLSLDPHVKIWPLFIVAPTKQPQPAIWQRTRFRPTVTVALKYSLFDGDYHDLCDLMLSGLRTFVTADIKMESPNTATCRIDPQDNVLGCAFYSNVQPPVASSIHTALHLPPPLPSSRAPKRKKHHYERKRVMPISSVAKSIDAVPIEPNVTTAADDPPTLKMLSRTVQLPNSTENHTGHVSIDVDSQHKSASDGRPPLLQTQRWNSISDAASKCEPRPRSRGGVMLRLRNMAKRYTLADNRMIMEYLRAGTNFVKFGFDHESSWSKLGEPKQPERRVVSLFYRPPPSAPMGNPALSDGIICWAPYKSREVDRARSMVCWQLHEVHLKKNMPGFQTPAAADAPIDRCIALKSASGVVWYLVAASVDELNLWLYGLVYLFTYRNIAVFDNPPTSEAFDVPPPSAATAAPAIDTNDVPSSILSTSTPFPANGIEMSPKEPIKTIENVEHDRSKAIELRSACDVELSQVMASVMGKLDNIVNTLENRAGNENHGSEIKTLECCYCRTETGTISLMDGSPLASKCQHTYCVACVGRLVQTSIDERKFPVICGACRIVGISSVITFNRLLQCVEQKVIPQELFSRFESAFLKSTINLVSCPGCGFEAIPPPQSRVTCLSCKLVFCWKCNTYPFHTGKPCSATKNHMPAIGVKACPECAAPIIHYRGHGCHHIRDHPKPSGGLCTYHFCFACGGAYNMCGCRFQGSTFCNELCDCPTCPDCKPEAHCRMCDSRLNDNDRRCKPIVEQNTNSNCCVIL